MQKVMFPSAVGGPQIQESFAGVFDYDNFNGTESKIKWIRHENWMKIDVALLLVHAGRLGPWHQRRAR